MNNPTDPNADSLVQCSICRKEVPKDAALMPEGAEYIEHFCGTECYDQYFAEHSEAAPASQPAGKP
jgi:hypothetical protein